MSKKFNVANFGALEAGKLRGSFDALYDSESPWFEKERALTDWNARASKGQLCYRANGALLSCEISVLVVGSRVSGISEFLEGMQYKVKEIIVRDASLKRLEEESENRTYVDSYSQVEVANNLMVIYNLEDNVSQEQEGKDLTEVLSQIVASSSRGLVRIPGDLSKIDTLIAVAAQRQHVVIRNTGELRDGSVWIYFGELSGNANHLVKKFISSNFGWEPMNAEKWSEDDEEKELPAESQEDSALGGSDTEEDTEVIAVTPTTPRVFDGDDDVLVDDSDDEDDRSESHVSETDTESSLQDDKETGSADVDQDWYLRNGSWKLTRGINRRSLHRDPKVFKAHVKYLVCERDLDGELVGFVSADKFEELLSAAPTMSEVDDERALDPLTNMAHEDYEEYRTVTYEFEGKTMSYVAWRGYLVDAAAGLHWTYGPREFLPQQQWMPYNPAPTHVGRKSKKNRRA
jgi:hypothetical protein